MQGFDCWQQHKPNATEYARYHPLKLSIECNFYSNMPVICSPFFPEECRDYDAHFATFPYELSDFQKHAIKAIVDGHHVLVCAPTGSGKTLPAEFAIRHFASQGRRVIYTSPIKALSNQKYHDFSKKFPDISVGLCTGDIKTNPTADLLIMTAEILNNRLFQLSSSLSSQQSDLETGNKYENSKSSASQTLSFDMDIESELAVVIMDEVHYINDESRGHVWEQTILTLPPQIQMVMLSATLDGPDKFAEWIESTRPLDNNKSQSLAQSQSLAKRVFLAQTSNRIVPLSHYAFFPKAPLALLKATKATPLEPLVKDQTDRLIVLQTHTNKFQPAGYKAVDSICEAWITASNGGGGAVSRKHVLNSLATFMKGSDDPNIDDTMLPAIVFLFSRKQVEECAADMTANILSFDSKIPYNAAHECEQIIRRLPNWREYLELPEYKTLVKLLEKGVGIHHSGMIPVLREIVELMISQKKIYMLFATESFAIGLDCPIRTAVFTGLTKWDGSQDRFLYAHEYTQMAGRAGRRGIDTVGHVIHLPLLFRRGIPSELAYRDVLSNRPQTLVSKFHIDYKMVLSLLKKGIQADFHLFAEKSMTKNAILGEIAEQRQAIQTIQKSLEEKRAASQHTRTPPAICTEYQSLNEQCKTAVNKKRKDLERKIAAIKDQHKYIVSDLALLSTIQALESDLSNRTADIDAAESYLRRQTNCVSDILARHGVLTRVEHIIEESCDFASPQREHPRYELSPLLGTLSSQLSEIHPIPFAELIVQEDWFNGWTARQMVGLLSSFVDVRLPEQDRALDPKCDDPRVLKAVESLQKSYVELRQEEMELGSHTGIEYEGALCYDMADTLMEWTDLSEEVACKAFLAELLAGGVSAGDFAKSCMKLSAVAKELLAMCETLSATSISEKPLAMMLTLSQIDGLILKHIATTQSLYL